MARCCSSSIALTAYRGTAAGIDHVERLADADLFPDREGSRVYRIRARMLERLSRIALSEYETLGSGRVSSHFVTDLNAVDGFLGASISGFLVAALSLAGVAGVLLWMNWRLALFILLLNPVVIGFSTRLGKRVKELKKRENSAFEVFQEALTETLDALNQIRAMNREETLPGPGRPTRPRRFAGMRPPSPGSRTP
jgi:ABC-type multidrug transport system fused ATPase/permease subunit